MISDLDKSYSELHLLHGIKANFNIFYNSWWNNKCLNYSGHNLTDYYDIFFSRFVVYNSLYNTIVYTKESFGLLQKKINKNGDIIERREHDKAVKLMAKELSDTSLDALFNKSEIISSMNALVDILEFKKFVITHKAGQQIPAADKLILVKLKGINNNEKYSGFLELLYNVRCNLFHGSKGYEHDQIELLKPVNQIIFYIVNALYDSFIIMIDDIEIKIKSLKER